MSGIILIIAAYFLSTYMLGSIYPFVTIVAGLVVGLAIGQLTEYYTSEKCKPVQNIAQQSETGSATTIISGLAVGIFDSTAFSTVYCFSNFLAYWAGNMFMADGGLFGIAMAAVGMLSTCGMTIAVDAYGPIADNAGGIAEMSELPESVH